jgi:hypothetical protein
MVFVGVTSINCTTLGHSSSGTLPTQLLIRGIAVREAADFLHGVQGGSSTRSSPRARCASSVERCCGAATRHSTGTDAAPCRGPAEAADG